MEKPHGHYAHSLELKYMGDIGRVIYNRSELVGLTELYKRHKDTTILSWSAYQNIEEDFEGEHIKYFYE